MAIRRAVTKLLSGRTRHRARNRQAERNLPAVRCVPRRAAAAGGGRQRIRRDRFSEIFGAMERPVTKDDLSKMRYCDAVINETLRLYPPVPVIMRYADRDLQLDGCTIPRGATCAISVWGAGRAACWGADADQFRPERWFDTLRLPPPSAFSPFSYGRRSCIGKRYAMALMKTILVHLLRRFKFESEDNELEFKVDIALRTTRGHLIKVQSRN
ncbi:Cytochrome P450 4V2 [Eumeta japonica]|uniref:Cytochrome P450 4V2 n=1 Tax=Eumeta variegata TaxID=151549 RepID=A0A4C1X8L6_EUMVA|nr:Cytochrome P450 4V2 [Eumeta japonica]